MKYQQAELGRVFVVKFEHGDNLHESIKELVSREEISFATISFLGALLKADIVAGPKEPVIPPDPEFMSFNDGREVVGFGTIVNVSGECEMHIHSAIGKGEKTLTGCLRKNAEIFLTIEAVVQEIAGDNITRKMDPETGFKLLDL